MSISGDYLAWKLINLDLNVEILTKANEKSIWSKSNLNLSFINIDFSIMNEREHLRKIICQFHRSRWVCPEDGYWQLGIYCWISANTELMINGYLRWVTSRVGFFSGLVLTDYLWTFTWPNKTRLVTRKWFKFWINTKLRLLALEIDWHTYGPTSVDSTGHYRSRGNINSHDTSWPFLAKEIKNRLPGHKTYLDLENTP